MTDRETEIEALEQAAAWRRRKVDAGDSASAAAADLLDTIAQELYCNDYETIWQELRSIGNWLAESDTISDYASLANEYRGSIGVSEHPADAQAYLRHLLSIAQSLI